MLLSLFVRETIGDFLTSKDPWQRFAVDLGLALLVLVITLILSRVARMRLRQGLQRSGLQINASVLLARLLWIAVWVLGFSAVLYIFGVGLTPLAALIGVVGLAASLALQQLLQNLVAGIYLLAERPFHIGDLIAVAAPGGIYEGTVEDIQMRTTHLRNRYDELILLPNSAIFAGVVTNRTAVGGYASHLRLSFPRSTDPEAVRQRIVAVVGDLPGVLSRPAPDLYVEVVAKDTWTANLVFWISGGKVEAGAVWAIADAFPDASVNDDSPGSA